MIKFLHTISLAALVCAGFLLVTCVRLWLVGIPESRTCRDVSVVEKFQSRGDPPARSNSDIASPLMKQAAAYALYLNPPKPPAPRASAPRTNVQPAYVPADTTPKFRLLATTYYRSCPEKSLALVSEPGKGDYWIKKNDRLGHFIVERVEKGSIVYRQGDQVCEMKVAEAGTAQLAQIQSRLSSSTQTLRPDLRSLSAPQPGSVE